MPVKDFFNGLLGDVWMTFLDGNSDGQSDTLVVTWENVAHFIEQGDLRNTFQLAISDGSSFTKSVWDKWSTASTWTDVLIGDFNGDGKDDIAGRDDLGRWVVGLSSSAERLSGCSRLSRARVW